MGSKDKKCSICTWSYPLAEFDYGGRAGRSYCHECSKAEQRARAKGGKEGAKAFRVNMRIWSATNAQI